MKKTIETKIIEGPITLELHGYLTTLKINLPQAEDIIGGDYTLGKAIFESGIPTTAVEKIVVNQSLVTMAHKIKVGDYVVLYPLSVK